MINPKIQLQIKDFSICKSAPIGAAIKLMDKVDRKLLIVTDKGENYVNIISIGDIQRSLIKNQNFEVKVGTVLRASSTVASTKMSNEEIKKMMLHHRTEFMPVLDKNELVKVIFWEDLFENKHIPCKAKYDIPVVIMAGGKGTRMRPITNVIPKPLIPIGEKAIVEHIVNRFVDLGSKRFFFSINYLGEMIKNYFKRISDKPYSVDFFMEDKPLGTAGSLHLMKDQLNETFIISNCDILVDQDYSEIIQYHRENNFQITMVAAIKNYGIPYGTLELGEGGKLISLSEKPQLNYFINAGLYILEPSALKHVPENSFFHITHLIEKLINQGDKVGVFPVSEGAWSDIGEWDVYRDTLARFEENSIVM